MDFSNRREEALDTADSSTNGVADWQASSEELVVDGFGGKAGVCTTVASLYASRFRGLKPPRLIGDLTSPWQCRALNLMTQLHANTVLEHDPVHPPVFPAQLLMSFSLGSSALPDRLATACFRGDLPSVTAAVADGASVNERGRTSNWSSPDLPLTAAVMQKHHDVVVWLLSHGANPNGDRVMHFAVSYSTADMLQLMIDAGGDVSRKSNGMLPLFWAMLGNFVDKLRVLLEQPSLNLAVTFGDRTAQQHARDFDKPALAGMITEEVSGGGSERRGVVLAAIRYCDVQTNDAGGMTDRETSGAGTTAADT